MATVEIAEAPSRMLINGELVQSLSGKSYENVNPATEEVLGNAPDGDESDVLRAIASARRAFDESTWSTNPALRHRCLTQLVDALSRSTDEIGQIVVAEAGSPVALLAGQVELPLQIFRYTLDLMDGYDYERNIAPFGVDTNGRTILRREARGVVAAITPWNFPFMLNVAKIAPALAAGNTVVLKPAPETPWSATVIGRIIAEKTDLPAGVVNIVTSEDRAKIGESLVSDPRVDVIAFTGSTATGRHVSSVGAVTVKKSILELGGKSARIVLDDADLALHVAEACLNVCVHSGQGCAINTRLLVPRPLFQEAVEAASKALRSVSYGDPLDPVNIQGPQISARQRDRVLSYIDRGVSEGSTVVVGGGRPEHLKRGYFVEPTLLVNVDPGSTVAQEEIFGPVLALIAFEDDDDAVRIANDTIYGLSASVESASVDRALSVARRLRAGTVAVNGGIWSAPNLPYGGYKQSGLGREFGLEGFEEYFESKVIGVGRQAPVDA